MPVDKFEKVFTARSETPGHGLQVMGYLVPEKSLHWSADEGVVFLVVRKVKLEQEWTWAI
jgi:hypothetical protein